MVKGATVDGHRFDSLVRAFAAQSSRRTFVGLIAAGLGAIAFPNRAVGQRCRDVEEKCTKNDRCCSGFCDRASRENQGSCARCESEIVCDRICCPADALQGCTEVVFPGGPVIGCLCPEGTLYDFVTNTCLRDTECLTDADCPQDRTLHPCYASVCVRGTCELAFVCEEGLVCKGLPGNLTCGFPACITDGHCKSCCTCLDNGTCAFTCSFTENCTTSCQGHVCVDTGEGEVCGATSGGVIPCSSTAECPVFTWCNPSSGMCDPLCSGGGGA
jgi:hypothetical protein